MLIKKKLYNPDNTPPSKKVINCYSMKYHKFLSGKHKHILNNNNNTVKIAFNTYDN